MRTIILVGLVSLMYGISSAEVPKLFTQKSFSSASLAEAANHYVIMGESEALKEFAQLSTAENGSDVTVSGSGVDVKERIGWMCRILYSSKDNIPLRAPKFGALPLPENVMTSDKWPLFPLAYSGSSYFVLNHGYTPYGNMESLDQYLAYCRKHGVFRTTPVEVPSKEQAERDALTLRQSSNWQSIQWTDNGSFSFPMGETLTWGYLQNQLKPMDEAPDWKPSLKSEPSALTLR